MTNNILLYDANEIYYNKKKWITLYQLMNSIGGEMHRLSESRKKYFDGTTMYDVSIYTSNFMIGRYFGKMDFNTGKVVFNVQRYEMDVYLNRSFKKYNLPNY